MVLYLSMVNPLLCFSQACTYFTWEGGEDFILTTLQLR